VVLVEYQKCRQKTLVARREGPMKVAFVALVLGADSLAVTGDGEQPKKFKVTTKRADDAVEVQAEKDRTVFSVKSPFGISQAVIERKLDVEGQATQRSVLDALEARYPMLCWTIRDHVTGQRRPMLRFFACQEDLSHELPDAPLPDAVASGAEPFFVVGASPEGSLDRRQRCGRAREKVSGLNGTS